MRFIKFAILFITFVFLTSCSNKTTYVKKTDFALGTICTISLPSSADDSLFEESFDLIGQIEDEISAQLDDSYIGQLNINKEAEFPKEIYDFVKDSYTFSNNSSSVFNPSLGGVIKLWDIGGENPRIPSDEELSSINTNAKEVVFDDDTNTISIPYNMDIDLGGIGKGYVADKLKSFLLSKNVKSGIINLGGNILLIGEKDKNTNWTIGLQKPFANAGVSYILLSLKDVSVVTSGPYERYFEDNGKIYHHILDPKTLYPSDSDIVSSTIISSDSTLADALSTTCFILGSEKALDFLKNYPQVEAVFLLKNDKIVFSDNFDETYSIKDSTYSL